MLLVSRILIAGLLLSSSACAHGHGAATNSGTPQPTELNVRVNVTNHYTLSMEVYANGSGISHRLGLVSPGTVRSFVLPPAMVGNGPVEFVAQPSGAGPVAQSGQIIFGAGDVVDFEITIHLFDSHATVRQ